MQRNSSEVFHEALKAQYRDQVQAAIWESESNGRTTLNLGVLKNHFDKICKAAIADGLTEVEIYQIIDEVSSYNEEHHKNVA